MMKSQVKTSIWHSYKRNIELHVVPYIGDRVLKDVNASVLNKLYENLLADGKKNANEGLSAKTVRHIHTTIHKALSDAVDADILGINPATKAKPPKPRATATDKLNFWRVDELAAFLRHVEAHVWKRFGTYLR
jgi:hypothetical protein